MGDVLRDRIGGYLNDRLSEVAASLVTYRRGDDEFEILARASPPEAQEIDDDGAYRDVNQQVWIVKAEDMKIDDASITPAPGDQITSDGIVFDVASDGGIPCFRWSDPWRKAMRIYTKESKQATA